VHSEQVRRLYTFVTTYANLTAATLALGLTTFTMEAMQTALPLPQFYPGVRYSSSFAASHFASWAASQFYRTSASDLAFS